ncbi:hypothetical protein N1851_000275 [Merluccius polli]|uniref:Uncharacterized protein n=1 Tax=Merluccius polli TaxID=89951 RepID=A0AA47NDD4_MERPO|nr:hypothetical protein N1851_000275 [Merluccius polli]
MDKGKYKDLGLQHSLDMWHGAKNLAKKIHAAAQVKGQSSLSYWLKDVVNHFWWCCKTADSFEEFLDLWFILLHHVTNEHQWVLGACQHADLESGGSQQWLERDSMAHEALKSIVGNKRWLNVVHKYLNFRSTADLESFQSHILMYASKRTAFSPPVYQSRMLLAAMDYNFHKGRPEYRRLFKKNARRYMLYTVKTSKTYGYIPELQSFILRKRLAGKGMPRQRTVRPDDPRRYGLLPSVPAPTIEELLHTQVRRGLGAVGCYDQRPGSKLGFRVQCLAQGHFDTQTVWKRGSRGSNRRPYAAGNNTTVTLTQCPMLPKDILPIGSIPKLPIVIPWLSSVSYNQDIISVLSVKLQNVFFQTIQLKMWHVANAVVRTLATASSLQICGHFPAVPTGAPWESSDPLFLFHLSGLCPLFQDLLFLFHLCHLVHFLPLDSLHLLSACSLPLVLFALVCASYVASSPQIQLHN